MTDRRSCPCRHRAQHPPLGIDRDTDRVVAPTRFRGRCYARLLGEVFDELFGKVPAGLADRSYFPADAPVTVTLTAGLVSRLLEAGADVAEAIGERSNS
jgi:hypothetical protein